MYADRSIGGPFYATAGLIYNLNRVNAVSVPADSSIVIAGISYNQADAGKIVTTVRWPALAPYLGLGYHSRAHAHRPMLVVEAGTYYEGRARVEFQTTGAIAANEPRFKNYFDEGRRQLTTDFAPVTFYPVMQLGVRFPL